jgi:hypothetical protein
VFFSLLKVNKSDNQIPLTVEQINAIKLENRIIDVHSMFNGNLIVICRDRLKRMIKFDGNQIEWLDSYNEQ